MVGCLVSQHLNQKGRCGGSTAPLHVLGDLPFHPWADSPPQMRNLQAGGRQQDSAYDAWRTPVQTSRNQGAIKADVRSTLPACGLGSSSDEAQICLSI